MNFTTQIDNARAYGKVRELKIKMNKTNMTYLCHIDPDFCEYAIEQYQSFDTTLNENMLIGFLLFLIDKNLNLNDICEKMIKKYNQDASEWIIKLITKSYNEFYLNDAYYYNGRWYDGNWYNNDEDFETQDKRHNAFFYGIGEEDAPILQ